MRAFEGLCVSILSEKSLGSARNVVQNFDMGTSKCKGQGEGKKCF